MEQQEKKNACVIFRSVYEAAQELDKDQALELLLTYTKIGLGEEVNLDECSQIVRLILKQNIPYLDAAERRRIASIENGKKGKDAGKRGGRPRKGETKEQAYERRNPQETPNNPQDNIDKNPQKPLEKEKEKEYEKDKEIEYTKETIVTKEEKYSFEEFSNLLKDYCIIFIRKHQDYNYLLDGDSFKEHYYDNLLKFQLFVNKQLETTLSMEDCSLLITGYAKEYNI